MKNNAPFKQADEQVLIQGGVVLLLCLQRKPFHTGVMHQGFKLSRSFMLTERWSWIFQVSRFSSRSTPLSLKVAAVWTYALPSLNHQAAGLDYSRTFNGVQLCFGPSPLLCPSRHLGNSGPICSQVSLLCFSLAPVSLLCFSLASTFPTTVS